MTNSKYIVILLVAAWATWLFTGCTGSAHYDPRLVAIDSLLTTAPDSALLRLDAIEMSTLKNEGDRAYHALLLTQAQYRCYITATSDSTINRALSYYQRHSSEREKLTRAYIYKGAVSEELGDPEAAMRHYKAADETVPAGDQFLQGYIKLRIGNIYRDHIVADSSDVMMFKEALGHFKQVPDSFYILTCLSEIGSSYFKTNPDSVMPYLTQAHAMAQRLHEDDLLLINDIFMDEYKALSSDPAMINEAKNHALALLHDHPDADDLEDILMTAALTLAKQNKPDSASLYLNQACDILKDQIDTVFYYICQAEVARCRGDIGQYHRYMLQKTCITDSLTTNAMQYSLREVEEKYDNETLKNEKLRYRNILMTTVLGGLLALSLLTLVIMVIMHRAAQRKRQLREYEDQIARLNAEADELSTHLKANAAMSDGLKETIRHQLRVFSQLVEKHRSQLGKKPSKFSALFEECYKSNKPDISFWDGLQAYADSTHAGLITRLTESGVKLSESNKRVLCLCCCHLPTSVIMACMGYNEPHSVYNKKRRVAEALNLDIPLEAYIRSHEIDADETDEEDSVSCP